MISNEEIPKTGEFILGLDIGTTSVKACLLHVETKSIVQPVWKATKVKYQEYSSRILILKKTLFLG